MWVGAAIAAVSTVVSFLGSKKAEKSAEKQADLEAKREQLVTDERIRQLEVEERAVYGETLAQYAGSGVQATTQSLAGGPQPYSGSPLVVLAEQAREFQRERDITKEAGATAVQQALAGGKATADYYRYSGYANVAKGFSDIYTAYQAGRT